MGVSYQTVAHLEDSCMLGLALANFSNTLAIVGIP